MTLMRLVDVRLTCGAETCKTKIQSGTVNPTWHEEFRFGEEVCLAEDACISFRVKDYNTLTPSVDLGGAEVHVPSLTPKRMGTHRRWCPSMLILPRTNWCCLSRSMPR